MWPFRTDQRVLGLNRRLKGAAQLITSLRSELADAKAAVADANASVAAMQRRQERGYETYERIRAAEKEIATDRAAQLAELRELVADLQEQLADATGPNAVTADNERLARELQAEREKNALLDQAHAEASARLEQAEEELAGYRLEAGQ